MANLDEFVPLEVEPPQDGELWGPEKTFKLLMHAVEFFGLSSRPEFDPKALKAACEASYKRSEEFLRNEREGFREDDFRAMLDNARRELGSRADAPRLLADLAAGLAASFPQSPQVRQLLERKAKDAERARRYRARKRAEKHPQRA